MSMEENAEVSLELIRSTPFSTSDEFKMITKLLLDIENKNSKFKVYNHPIKTPESGRVIFYQCQSLKDKDYLLDQYFRFIRTGDILCDNRNLKKTYYQLHVPETKTIDKKRVKVNFQRHVYKLVNPINEQNSGVIIHYTGDHTLFVPHPHFNSKKQQPYTKTSNKTRDEIEKLVENEFSKPTIIYEKLVKNSIKNKITTDLQPIYVPRNVTQVYSVKKKLVSESKISKCEIFDCFDMSRQELGKFILRINLSPSYYVIFSEPTTLEISKKILRISNQNLSLEQLICYDTTFNMGNYYLSVLVMRNVTLIENPIYPVAFLIHEHKSQQIHEDFWRIISRELDLSTNIKNLPICTDAEKAITNSIKKIVPNSNLIRCSNHIKQDVLRWIRSSQGRKSTDLKILSQQISSLLELSTEKEYIKYLSKYKEKWTKSYLDYFCEHIEEDLKTASKFNIVKFSAFKNNLATNNLSESMNFMMKYRTDWKELRSDILLLKLIELQCSFIIEFERADRKLGKYMLNENVRRLEINLPNYSCYSSGEFIKTFKNTCSSDLSKKSTSKMEKDLKNSDSSKIDESSKFKRALKCFNLKSFEEISNLGLFVVKDIFSNEAYVVRKDDKIKNNFKCSCRSNVTCHHILCIKMHLGINISNEKKITYNLSILKKNTRNSKKRLGRKRPSPEDLDILVKEAMDSKKSLISLSSDSDFENNKTNQHIASENILSNSSSDENDYLCNMEATIDQLDKILNDSIEKINLSKNEISQLYSIKPSLIGNRWLEGSVIDDLIITLLENKNLRKKIFYLPESFYRLSSISINQIFCRSLKYEAYKSKLILTTVFQNNHWMLGVINFKLNKIYLIDSFAHIYVQNNKKKKDIFKNLFKIAHAISLSGDISTNTTDWKFIYAVDAPIQYDGTECGVIVCLSVLSLINCKNFPHIDNISINQSQRNRLWILSTINKNVYLDFSSNTDFRSKLRSKQEELRKFDDFEPEVEYGESFDEISSEFK